MISMQVRNNQQFNLDNINFCDRNTYYDSVAEGLANGLRMIGLFPVEQKYPEMIAAVFADSFSSALHIIGGNFSGGKLEYQSHAKQFPQTNYFECELAEKSGYKLINHPWVRPVRKQNIINENEKYEFYKLDGDEVHEVAVGPIHAGVIEPGHFRFQCHGEMVYHLEINLGYQHRGIEAMMIKSKSNQRLLLSESIAGDTVVANACAHCMAVENLSIVQTTLRSQVIRTIAEELERVAMHLTGLGGIANDIGFALAASSYGRLRTLVINSLAELCGSRFGRSLFVYGGVRFDFNEIIIRKILTNLELVRNDIISINDYMFSSTGALSRFDGTGTVTKDFAEKIGLVGFAARSSGVELDTRIHCPYGAYLYFPVALLTLPSGDVFARARLRALEIDESLRFLMEQIQNLPKGKIRTPIVNIVSNAGIISITEGWRGEVVHIVFTNESGEISQYKIKDPSFNNWYGLGLALRKTAISDFPLCNKSFDLSYAGHDL